MIYGIVLNGVINRNFILLSRKCLIKSTLDYKNPFHSSFKLWYKQGGQTFLVNFHSLISVTALTPNQPYIALSLSFIDSGASNNLGISCHL